MDMLCSWPSYRPAYVAHTCAIVDHDDVHAGELVRDRSHGI